MCVGCVGSPAEESSVRCAQRVFGGEGVAVGTGYSPARTGAECCVHVGVATDSSMPRLEGDSRAAPMAEGPAGCASSTLSTAVCERLQARGCSSVGITSLALSPWDADTFLVGSEGGLLLRCSFSSKIPSTAPSDGHSVTHRAPAVFSFRPGSGPVHSIHSSPFHWSERCWGPPPPPERRPPH